MAAQRGPCFSTDARALYDDDAADHAERDHIHRTRALGDAHRGEIRAARDHPVAADTADAGPGANGVSVRARFPDLVEESVTVRKSRSSTAGQPRDSCACGGDRPCAY